MANNGQSRCPRNVRFINRVLSSSWQCTTSVSARSTGFELPHSERQAPNINTLLLHKTRQNRQGTIIKVLFVHTLGSKLGKEIVRRNSVAFCFLRSTVGPRRLIIVIVGKYMLDLRRKVWCPHSDAISLSGWSRGPELSRLLEGPCHSDWSHNHKRPRCNCYNRSVFLVTVVVASVRQPALNLILH